MYKIVNVKRSFKSVYCMTPPREMKSNQPKNGISMMI